MTDSRLRELERTWQQSGDAEDGAAFLREQVRAGELSEADLRARAEDRDPAAMHALGWPELIARLDRWLAEQRPELYGDLRPGLELEAFPRQARDGFPLPALLGLLHVWRDGQEGDLGLYGRYKLISLEDARDDPGVYVGIHPFLLDDLFLSFVGIDDQGRVVEYLRDPDGEPPVITALAGSFEQWLSAFVESLEQDLWEPDPDYTDEEGPVPLRPTRKHAKFLRAKTPGFPRILDESPSGLASWPPGERRTVLLLGASFAAFGAGGLLASMRSKQGAPEIALGVVALLLLVASMVNDWWVKRRAENQ